MTKPKLTLRRTKLEKAKGDVLADLIEGMRASDVARKYGVARQSVFDFQERHKAELIQRKAELDTAVEDLAVTNKAQRLAAINDRWLKLRQLIDIRARDDRYTEPGYETGLMVRSLKGIGKNVFSQYEVDTGLLAEIRQIEHEAAEAMGQIPKADQNVNIRALFAVRQIDGGSAEIS